mgnify:FL=1|tara:strand:- start:169 stop:333 length:165 start_codon:yes stop_codon:yes gene_type:complete
MSPSTEKKGERLKELREQVGTCDDPFNLLAEFAYENERLRRQVSDLKLGMCKHI